MSDLDLIELNNKIVFDALDDMLEACREMRMCFERLQQTMGELKDNLGENE